MRAPGNLEPWADANRPESARAVLVVDGFNSASRPPDDGGLVAKYKHLFFHYSSEDFRGAQLTAFSYSGIDSSGRGFHYRCPTTEDTQHRPARGRQRLRQEPTWSFFDVLNALRQWSSG